MTPMKTFAEHMCLCYGLSVATSATVEAGVCLFVLEDACHGVLALSCAATCSTSQFLF
jgi:hypothetical protein